MSPSPPPPSPKQAKKRGTSKPRRWRPGTVALREIVKQQKATTCALPRLAVDRLVREIAAAQCEGTQLRFAGSAMLALQEGAETHLVELFKEAQTYAIHAGRETVCPHDLQLANANAV